MKALYEATNDYMGESYTRCYVWADSEDDAVRLAREAFEADRKDMRYPDEYVSNVRVGRLFLADSPSFVTKVSDNGWHRA